jgi:hypothetical protein
VTNPLENIDWSRLVSDALANRPVDLSGEGGVQGGFGGTDTPPVWEIVAGQFEPKPDYYSSLESWIDYKLGEKIWSKQREISISLKDNRYTAVKSCHGIGKSYIASRAIANWIDSHPPGDAFVVTTAPTAAQVSAILWRETQRAHRIGQLPGNIITAGYPQWKLFGELVGYGRKPADYADSAFQGIHAPFVLIVIDEASGVEEKLFTAVDALATNKNARVLAIGNPDDPTSYFAKVCKPNTGWHVIHVDGLYSPNINATLVKELAGPQGVCLQCRLSGRERSLLEDLMDEEEIPYSEEQVNERLADSLISPLWIEERLHRWVGTPSGSDTISKLSKQSSLFTAKVRGLFPESNTNGVIPLGWVEAAVIRWHNWNDQGRPLPDNPRLVLGVDVARQGEDQTSIAHRRGLAITHIEKHRHADTMEVTALVTSKMEKLSLAVVDVIGVGAGVVDRMRELQLDVVGFNAASGAGDLRDRSREFAFFNQRAAAWWNLREMLDPSRGFNIMLPDSELLKADLTTPRWTPRSGNPARIQIESKDDIKKRLGRSTDEADAVVQAFWMDSEAAEFYTQGQRAVSWWQGPESDEVPEAVRWVPVDATEQWLHDKELTLREESEYGGYGTDSRVGRGGHHPSLGR